MRKNVCFTMVLCFILACCLTLTGCGDKDDPAVPGGDPYIEQEPSEEEKSDSAQEAPVEPEEFTVPEVEKFSVLCSMETSSYSDSTAVRMYFFDDAGNRIEIRDLKGITKQYEYDANGKMISDTSYDSDSGAAKEKYVYTYNENGLKASEDWFLASNGEFSEECDTHIDYTYNERGILILEEEVHPESGNSYSTEYSFNDDGKPAGILYNANGHLYCEKKYTYQANESYTLETWGSDLATNYENYGVDYCYGIEEYDAGGNLCRSLLEIYGENPSTQELSFSYTYNEDGTKASCTDSTGVITYYTYENGLVVLEDSYNGDQHFTSIEREYDEYGNLIQKIETAYADPALKTDYYVPSDVVETTKYAYIGSNGTKTGYYAEIEEYYELHKQ